MDDEDDEHLDAATLVLQLREQPAAPTLVDGVVVRPRRLRDEGWLR
jgi:hypothetical protein